MKSSSDKYTDSYNPEEYTYEPISSVRIASIIFLLIFLAGICYNIYSFIFNEWCWDWRIITLVGFDSLLLIFFFSISCLAMMQNNLPAIDELWAANGKPPNAFPFYEQLQALECEFSGTLVLRHKTSVNYLEVYISHDKSWLFFRSMSETLGGKTLSYFAGSIFNPHGILMVKNETSPANVLPSLNEIFTVALPAASPEEVISLHRQLFEQAKQNQLEPIPLNLEKIATILINIIRADLDYQCKLGLMNQTSYDHYRLTFLGCVYATFRVWFFMVFEMGNLPAAKWVKSFQKQLKSLKNIQRMVDY